MTRFVFDTTLLPVLAEEYPDLPLALLRAGTASFVCAEEQQRALPEASPLREVFATIPEDVVAALAIEHVEQILASARASRGDGAEFAEVTPAMNAIDARLIALCVEKRHVLVCGRRAVAETAWKLGASVKNLREFLKAVGDPRYRWLDEQTGR